MEKPIVKRLTLEVFPRGQQSDRYDWINIGAGPEFVGKMRCRMGVNVLTIYSIMIFTGFRGSGFGRQTIQMLKQQFGVIVADRVRHSAVGFWSGMGFRDRGDGNWEYTKSS